MSSNEAVQVLDDLLETLDDRCEQKRLTGGGDAIDAVLAGVGRSSRVRSLRDAPEVAAFREALVAGRVRMDALNRLLGLIHEIVIRIS